MKYSWLMLFSVLAIAAPNTPAAQAAKAPQFPQDVTFTTLKDGNSSNSMLLPFAIEGLTGDADGNLYTTGRQLDTSKLCPVWKLVINGLQTTRKTVGFIPNSVAAPCNPSGITFDAVGNLYIADSASGGNIRKVTPDPTGCASDDSTALACAGIPTSTNYATNVPGTNGLAFDRNGDLWTGDGTTGKGRVWKIGTGGGADCAPPTPTNCVEAFRIQPMRNGVDFDGDVNTQTGITTQGVGRQARDFPPGTFTVSVTVAPTVVTPAGGQDLVANGVAFDHSGNLFVIDTARGALWKVQFDNAGNVLNVGCDETFTANTLCLSNIFVAHPILEGGDGIALDDAGNIWVDANERNAVAVVTKNGQVTEIFRNPVNAATNLRNDGADAAAKQHILEFPTSPFLSGNRFCTSQSDGNRRDNSPNSGGEIISGAGGKISCMTDENFNLIHLNIPGMPLPVH